MSLYTNILKQSWSTIWKYKYLWWFGALAILFGSSIEIELLNNFLNKSQNSFNILNKFLSGGLFNASLISGIKNFLSFNNPSFGVMIIIFIIFFLIILVILYSSVIGQVIVIDHSAQIKKNKTNLSIKSSLSKNKNNLLLVIGLNILIKVVIFIVFIIISLPIVMTINQTSILADSIYLLLFIILLPLVIIFSFIVKYVISYIIVYKQSLSQAFRNGFVLFKENWLISIEMSFLLFLINIIASLAVIILISALGIPVWFLAIMGAMLINPVIFPIIILLGFFLFLIVFIMGGGIIIGFILSAWTNLFLQLNEKGGASKLSRTIGRIGSK